MENALTRMAASADPDIELVKRMAAGDEEALRELYAAYGRRLFAHALRLTGSEAVAEEVLQDSLLGAWKGASSFRGGARVSTWLLGIVHRQALNAIRRKKLPVAPLAEAETVADDTAHPGQRAEAGDRRRVIAAALARLPADQRAALTLVFFQGLSLTEVAAICDCPVGTVKSRLHAAKQHVRRALADAGWQAEDLI